MMTLKVDHMILRELRQALFISCPTIEETSKKLKKAFLESDYPELAEDFDILSEILVTNLYSLRREKPIFELKDIDLCLSYLLVLKDKESRKKLAIGEDIFKAIKDEIKKEGKLPIVIKSPDHVVILEGCADYFDTHTIFGLPEEIEKLKQKLIESLEKAHTINSE